jgi:hypothetical protein
METALTLLLILILVYFLYDEVAQKGSGVIARGRLCDYEATGSVFEDPKTALARGVRLLEFHVYSDERDQPVVATSPQNDGYDVSLENVSFEQCCVDIANDAFPSKDPLIVSIMFHTDKAVVMDRVADHLSTTVHRHLVAAKDIQREPIDSFANKIILVSGGSISGTRLEPLINLSWNDSGLRRLTYQQALHPRDAVNLVGFNRDNITMVVPEVALKSINVNPERPRAMGCQWNFVGAGPVGFAAKPERLTHRFFPMR